MGARSLRNIRQRRQLAEHHELLVSTSTAYPPIYLSPSISFDPFSVPSPSPALPPSAPDHSSVPTAAIVGSGVAAVVVLAATATIISTVAGKAGLSCLIGPIFQLFSSLGKKFLGPCTGRLQSLRSTLNRWSPASKRQKSGDDAAHEEDGTDHYNAFGDGSPTRRKSESECAAVAVYSLATSPLRDVVEGQAEQLEVSVQNYIAMTVSDLESHLKKQKDMILQPLQENIARAQEYGQCFLSLEDLVSLHQSADAHINEVISSKLGGNASHAKASSSETISGVWKQTGDAAALAVFEEAVEGGTEKANTVANDNAKEELPAKGDSKAHESEEEELKHRGRKRGANEEGRRRGQVSNTEDASEELQVEDMAPASSHIHDTNNRALVPTNTRELQVEEIVTSAQKHHTSGATTHNDNMALAPHDTGGKGMRSQGTGHMVAVPKKTMQAPIGSKGKERGQETMKTRNGKRKRSSNLGHVSFSCEMSSHRLRFFTACRSGGTYGSPPSSPDHHNSPYNNDNNYKNYYYTNSQPHNNSSAEYHAPLYYHHHPSQSILVQQNPHPIPDYGCPFDGVL